MQKDEFRIFEAILSSVIGAFKWVVLFAIVLVALTGIYKVDSGECAVVLRFGRLTGETYEDQVKKPGLHFALPAGIDEVVRIPVERVLEQEITTHYGDPSKIDPDVTKNGYLLTGDNNIILIDTKIKYQVTDPVSYALYVKDMSGILEGMVGSELNALVSGMAIDDILTGSRASLGTELLENVQASLDEKRFGVSLLNVEFMEMTPPGETKPYFDAVNSAAVGKQTLIQEANDYQSTTILKAQAKADETVNKANVEQSRRLSVTNDEMAEFQGLYDEYMLNPQVVLDGVFRERVSTVLTRMGATVVMPDNGSPVLFLP